MSGSSTDVGLRVFQLNMRRGSMCLVLLTQHLATHHADVLLLQDPPEGLVSGGDCPAGYDVYLPTRDSTSQPCFVPPLVAILVRSTLRARAIPFSHPRVCGIFVSTARCPLAFLSGYVHHTDGSGLDALASLVTIARRSTPLILVGADTNGHSPWWGPPNTLTNNVGAQVEEFILSSRLGVANRWPSPPTFRGAIPTHVSWIDVTLTSFPLAPLVHSWRVLPDEALESDHSLLAYTLSLEAPRVYETRPAWRRVDWDHFRPTLRHSLHTHCPLTLPLHSPDALDAFSTALDTALQATAARHVPLSHRGGHRPHTWWSPHLSELKTKLTRARRRWHHTRLAVDKSTVNACSRALRKAVAEAKQDSWRTFCETTSERNMWDQFQRISRPHRPQRVGDR